MNLIKRLKRTWKLAKKDEKSLEDFMKLTDKQIMDLPDEDQKVVFLGQGTEEEYNDMLEEDKGLKHIFGKGL